MAPQYNPAAAAAWLANAAGNPQAAAALQMQQLIYRQQQMAAAAALMSQQNMAAATAAHQVRENICGFFLNRATKLGWFEFEMLHCHAQLLSQLCHVSMKNSHQSR